MHIYVKLAISIKFICFGITMFQILEVNGIIPKVPLSNKTKILDIISEMSATYTNKTWNLEHLPFLKCVTIITRRN